MFDIFIVTNRKLCRENFSERIEKIAAAHPAGIILREKDLTEDEYERLAVKALEICRKHGVPCILHGFQNVAAKLDCSSLHLPLSILRSLSDEEKARFSTLGASCHSVDDAIEA
ncbi:MAG: thiamine phosphate synthase, partial [Acutalibacteraceae bacterium]